MTAPHVVHVSQPVEAGVARVVLDLLDDQQRAGWAPSLVCPQGWLAERAVERGVPWTEWPASREPGPQVVAETRRLARRLRAAPPDLVHLHSSKAGLAGRLAVRGRLPTVFQPHAWSFAAADGPTARLALTWERLAARWTSLELCCSEEERREGRDHGIGGRSEVVPNGVDLARFPRADAGDRAAARARLGLPGELPVAVCIGRLSRQKGQDVALAAWPAVRSQVHDATLLVVGDGPDRAALEAAARDGVRLLGERHDVADLLAAADLALLPSRWEGLALSLLEAMASGRSVVTTQVAGSASVLLGGSAPAGAVVPVDDAVALADAVVLRLRDPERASREGDAGRRTVEQHHDVSLTTAAVRQAYAAVLPRGG